MIYFMELRLLRTLIAVWGHLPYPSDSGATGSSAQKISGRATSIGWWTSSRIWPVCGTGMNGVLIPAITRQGTTNPALLKEKQPAAIFYFLDAFKRFDAMTPEQVRDVAFEIALLGRNGLDYASPDEKYELRSVPDRKFSGLHLMCLMYAGFKRVAPEHDVQMDLNDSFLTALQMHENGEGKR